ncbi:MAG: LptA/OstA family protein [Nitrospira sp.]|jgi:lipopolysaccharide export system protein LptA|nr:LptA/OstA family protein [Nitrospira sp.]
MYMWICLLLLSLLSPGIALAVLSPDGGASKVQEPAAPPTNITAKKMTVRNQESQAVFEGTVVLTQGTLMVYSDKMVVLFHPRGAGEQSDRPADSKSTGGASSPELSKRSDVMPGSSGQSVKQIEATGHVRIEREGGKATSNKAVFDNSRRIVTLTGDPVAWEKGTRVTGEKIIIYLDEDRSVVEGGTHLRIDGEGGGSQ